MEMVQSASEAADRAAVYRLLSAAYLAEADATLIELFGGHPAFTAREHGGAQPSSPARLPQGEKGDPLKVSLSNQARLRPEYAHIFVLNILPYESLYVDGDDPMLDSDATQAVVSAYRAAGFALPARYNPGAPDHVGLELACLAELNKQEAAALQQGAQAVGAQFVVSMLAARQRSFLQSHLAAWVAPFALAVERLTREPWYQALARFTADFVLGDLDRLWFDKLTMSGTDPPLILSVSKDERVEGSPPSLSRGPAASAEANLPLAEQSLRAVAHTLTIPALSGFQLSRADLTRIAAGLNLSAGFAARERLLMNLFESSARYGVLSELLRKLGEIAGGAADRYHAWGVEFPGAKAVLQAWESRAAATVRELQAMQELAGTDG